VTLGHLGQQDFRLAHAEVGGKGDPANQRKNAPAKAPATPILDEVSKQGADQAGKQYGGELIGVLGAERSGRDTVGRAGNGSPHWLSMTLRNTAQGAFA
jgi:hypothetical protein